MEITKEQIKELVKIAQAIDAENRIDDDVTGGYVEEPYNTIIERIYAVVNECEGKEVDAGENTLPIHGVSDSTLDELIQCADCNHKHTKGERIRKSDGTWETYHCPECDSESYYTI